MLGVVLLAAGCFLFWPAALHSSYAFFLFALFVIASGLSFLETASNPFIAQLADPDSSERRLNFSQAFNPLGASTAALIGTVFIFSGVELNPQEIAARQAAHTYQAYLRFETLRVVRPYLVIGIVAVVWALLILRTEFPVITSEDEADHSEHGSFRQLLGQRHFLFAAVAQFFYVGAQVGTWSCFISYVQDYAHMLEKNSRVSPCWHAPTYVAKFASHDTDVKPFTAQDSRFTAKGDSLYAIELAWPDTGEAVIHFLNEAALSGQNIVSLSRVSDLH